MWCLGKYLLVTSQTYNGQAWNNPVITNKNLSLVDVVPIIRTNNKKEKLSRPWPFVFALGYKMQIYPVTKISKVWPKRKQNMFQFLTSLFRVLFISVELNIVRSPSYCHWFILLLFQQKATKPAFKKPSSWYFEFLFQYSANRRFLSCRFYKFLVFSWLSTATVFFWARKQ